MKKTIALLFAIFLPCSVLGGEIALSFDDAPTPDGDLMSGEEKTTKIIQGLKSQAVDDALFFLTSRHINQKSIKRIKRYTDAGFHLANHSHMHISANKTDPTEFLLDFYQSHLITKDLKNLMKLHRFPYLHYGSNTETRETIYKGLKELGYEIGYVTVDNFDWYINGKLLEAHKNGKKINYDKLRKLYVETLWHGIEFYDDIAKKSLGRSPKHVLLLHENEVAALFIGDLVKHIKSKGWKIISPAEAYQDPISKQYSSELSFNKQGRVAAIAHDKGVDKSLLRHESENEKFLDDKFKQYAIFD